MFKTRHVVLAAAFFGWLSLSPATASIPITASGETGDGSYILGAAAYTQSFDTLPASGTFTWVNHSTLPGWFAANHTGGLNTTAVTLDGTTNPGNLTLGSVGTAGSNERALFFHTQLESTPTFLGLAFENQSGQDLSSFTLAYSPEQWREVTNNRSVTVAVQYRVGATLADLHLASGWTPVPGLEFSTLNGAVSSAATLTATGVPVSVPSGASLWFRWVFANTATSAQNSHDLLAIDNVSFSANASGEDLAPVITTQPLSQSASVGDSVSFSVVATGQPAPTFQWFKGITPIPGATTSSLTIMPVALTDAADYWVTATNTVGTATSDPATLTVSENLLPPVILTQPASVTARPGQSLSLVVSAGGSAPFTYQWFKTGQSTPVGSGSVFTINSASLADSGTYTVTVSNAVSSVTSAPATIGVSEPADHAKYNLTGFATLGSGTTGGGVVAETDPAYRKCATPLEFITAIRDSNKTANAVKVIEITADLDLGWNEIDAATKALASVPIRSHATPKLHPTLIASGVSLIDMAAKSGLTIFSAYGATIKHATFNIKGTSNIIVRNLKFDEMWEWDEATKGDYDSNDWDFMVLSNGGGVKNVWVDHCTFTKAYDGIADIKKGTENVTFSWCRYIGDDGASNPNSHVRVQIALLEANRSAYPFYNFLRTNGFSQEEIIQIIQGHGKGHLMGATSKTAENNSLSGTFHHLWFENVWDRCVPRLRGGQVHNYNIFVDDSDALIARRLRDTRADAMTSTARNTLNNTYNFSPHLNGSISTEGGAILVEKSIYQDCLTPLRNNQTDVTDPTFTGKILSLDSVYIFNNANGTTTTLRGNSTDPGSPMGPFQAPVIPFSWNTADGSRPYPAPPMDDPSVLPALLAAGAGAGVITWPKENWLMTSYGNPASDDDFSSWSIRNAVSGANEDPDRDGIVNLVEFALGLNPQQASTQGLPVLVQEGDGRVFRFTRPVPLQGLTYTVKTSTDLVNWNDTLSAHLESSTASSETWIANLPNDSPKRFVTLMIEQE
jgi:pectate lyase